MRTISATIITRNEALQLGDCIESLRGICAEIIVLDSLSEDDTCAVARALGARVFSQAYLGDGPQKSCAASYAQHDWILSIDADERLDADAQAWLRDAQLDSRRCYAFRRRNFVGARWIRAAGWYPDHVVRLYHRDTAGYSNRGGHAQVCGTARIERLAVHLQHYTYRDYGHWLQRIDALSTRDARTQSKAMRHISSAAPVLHAIAAGLRKLILKGGIWQGLDGWTIALTAAMKSYLKYLKILEYRNEALAKRCEEAGMSSAQNAEKCAYPKDR